ncbi:efflux RND transporter periplasmic adaptor subunit [Ideonella sp.]|uniref:efflux RND transporter periplasmic adaptor subunit n=1 Tax=Ideonella sp. TaxID=1929293 RepID=UPI0035AFD1AC
MATLTRLMPLALPALAVAWLAAPAGLAAATLAVPTVPVAAAHAAAGREADATLQAVRQATVAAQVGGNVLALLVKAGDAVRAGQPLARLDDRDAAAALARAQAAVAQARAERRHATLAAERARELRRQGFISQAGLDTAETQAQATDAALRQAEGGQRQAAVQQGFTTVTAPFDGVVLQTHLEAGDLASPGRAILTLYAPGALRAVVQVPASRAGGLGHATPQIELPGEGPAAGTPRWVTPLRSTALPGTDPVSQTVEWRLDLPAGLPGRPGQHVRVRWSGAAPPSAAPSSAAPRGPLSVPAEAVLRRGELTAVYVARDNGFTLRAVHVGTVGADGRVPVLAGVQAGERVAAQAERAGLAGAVPASSR